MKANSESAQHRTEHTHVDVVFENSILEVEDEMTAELVFAAGVQVENIICGAFHSVNLHQFVANILPMNNINRFVELMLKLRRCLQFKSRLKYLAHLNVSSLRKRRELMCLMKRKGIFILYKPNKLHCFSYNH